MRSMGGHEHYEFLTHVATLFDGESVISHPSKNNVGYNVCPLVKLREIQ